MDPFVSIWDPHDLNSCCNSHLCSCVERQSSDQCQAPLLSSLVLYSILQRGSRAWYIEGTYSNLEVRLKKENTRCLWAPHPSLTSRNPQQPWISYRWIGFRPIHTTTWIRASWCEYFTLSEPCVFINYFSIFLSLSSCKFNTLDLKPRYYVEPMARLSSNLSYVLSSSYDINPMRWSSNFWIRCIVKNILPPFFLFVDVDFWHDVWPFVLFKKLYNYHLFYHH